MDTMRRALCCILTFNANVISIVSMQHTAATMVMVVAVVRYNYFSLRKLLILMSVVRCKEYFFADTVSGALFLVGPIIFHSHLAAATMVFAPFEVLNFIIIVALDALGETVTWSKYLTFFLSRLFARCVSIAKKSDVKEQGKWVQDVFHLSPAFFFLMFNRIQILAWKKTEDSRHRAMK